MNLEQLNSRLESLKNDLTKTETGLRQIADQKERLMAQFHMLTGHLSEVNFQIQEAHKELAPQPEGQQNGEAHNEEAQQPSE